jgi:putative ABC transport system permease protein
MSWLGDLLRRRRIENDLAAEIQAHLDEKADALVEQGLSRESARLAARREFGNVTGTEERSRDVWRWLPVEDFLADLRFAVRQLRKAPGFALAGILTLALGIGANTAVFSVVNAVILRPLPYPASDRLVSVRTRTQRGEPHNFSYPNFFDLRAGNRVFEHLVCYRDEEMGLSGAGTPVNLPGVIVSWDLFEVLQVRPVVGRGFLPDEENDGQRVVVISHRLWVERFHADPSLVGQTIDLDRQPYAVVGVAPRGFSFPIGARHADFWTTLAFDASADTEKPMTERRGMSILEAVGRLKPGVSLAQSRAAADTILAGLARQYPDQRRNLAGSRIVPLIDAVVGDTREPILILLGAVGLVLLVACANMANLLLARTAERGREFALRASIGAGRGRLVRQLLAEGLVLSLAGATAGILLAAACLRGSGAFAADLIPRLGQAAIDGPVLGFSIGLALLATLFFSLAPALRVARAPLIDSLKQSSAGAVTGKDRLRGALVVLQIALGLVLLSGAGLLAGGFLHLMRRDPGFQSHGLLSFEVALPEPLQRGAKHLDFDDALLDRLLHLPGVASAATTFPLPLAGSQMTTTFRIEGRLATPSNQPVSDIAIVSRGYFQAMGVPLLEGRGFAETDDAKSPPVVVVNRAFADRFFPGERVLGGRIDPGVGAGGVRTGPLEIVGVVGNARQNALGLAPDPVFYFAARQLPWCCGSYVVRTAGSPLALESSIRRVVASIEAASPVDQVRTFDGMLSDGIARPRFQALLLGAFAIIALALTVVGLYGVLTYSVIARTREIGVRVALGARRGDVVGMILKEAGVLVALGVCAGVAGSLAGNRLLASMVHGADIPQPALLSLACCIILVAAALAAFFPARRAASIDPMTTLRGE